MICTIFGFSFKKKQFTDRNCFCYRIRRFFLYGKKVSVSAVLIVYTNNATHFFKQRTNFSEMDQLYFTLECVWTNKGKTHIQKKNDYKKSDLKCILLRNNVYCFCRKRLFHENAVSMMTITIN